MMYLRKNNFLKMKNTIKNWWNKGSQYYQEMFKIPIDNIYYGPFCPTEKELNLMDIANIKNKKILELGCGGGQCSIFLSKNGAICDGIDISENQIKYAKNIAEHNSVKINYRIGTGENLRAYKNNEFDIVLAVFSIQYIKNLSKSLNEINRVLKKGGKFIFSLDHPFYSVVSPKTMKVEENYNKCVLNETIKTTDIIDTQKWHNANSHKFIFFFRNISEIYNNLFRSGLIVEKIIESVSKKNNGPWDRIYSKKLSKNIPATIIFVTKKKV